MVSSRVKEEGISNLYYGITTMFIPYSVVKYVVNLSSTEFTGHLQSMERETKRKTEGVDIFLHKRWTGINTS